MQVKFGLFGHTTFPTVKLFKEENLAALMC